MKLLFNPKTRAVILFSKVHGYIDLSTSEKIELTTSLPKAKPLEKEYITKWVRYTANMAENLALLNAIRKDDTTIQVVFNKDQVLNFDLQENSIRVRGFIPYYSLKTIIKILNHAYKYHFYAS